MNKFGKLSFVLIVLGIIGGCSSAEKGGVGDKIEVDELILRKIRNRSEASWTFMRRWRAA